MNNDSISTLDELKYFLNSEKIKKIFILTGKNSYKKSGAEKIFTRLIKSRNCYLYFKNSYYPDLIELKKIILEIRKFKPDLILAIGGGSVIDYAKIANLENIDQKLKKKIYNNDHLSKKRFTRLIAIPTTAGSGAEVTGNAVIYINKKKFSLEGDLVKPSSFILLPRLILGNKKTIKSSSGIDAIAQAIESMISAKSDRRSQLFAENALKLLLKNYVDYYRNPTISNSKNMSFGSMLAGKAINITKTTAPHAISYPFTSIYGIPHGHAVSLTLEKFLVFNYLNLDKSQVKFDLKKRNEKIFKIFNVKNINDLYKSIKLIKKQTNLEDNFKKLNINLNSGLDKIISGVNSKRLKNNPVKVELKDLKYILTKFQI